MSQEPENRPDQPESAPPFDNVTTDARRNLSWGRKIVTSERLFMAALVLISIFFGLIITFVPDKFQIVVLGIIPALIGGLVVIIKPFIGICAFYFYEYFRPDYFIPALAPLRLALVIEVVTLVAWVIQLVTRKAGIKWHRFNWAYLGFLAVIASTVLTAANNRFAYDIFQGMMITFIIFVIATNVVSNVKRLNILIYILLAVHGYFAVKGIQSGGLVGGSLMGDENDLALAMNVFIPFAYFFFLGAKRIWAKGIYLSLLVGSVFATIVSLSRGGTVGLLAVIVFCIAKSKRRMIGFGVTILLGMVILAFAPAKYWEDASTITDTSEATAQSRLNYWMAAVRMYVDYPLTGVGAGNGPVRMPEYYRGGHAAATQWGRTFHGTLPQILAELGTLGMGTYLLMIYLATTILLRVRRQKFAANEQALHKFSDSILGGILAFLATGTFLSTGYYPQLWTMYLLTIALYHISVTQLKEDAKYDTALSQTENHLPTPELT